MAQSLLKPREAAQILGVSYPTLKQWVYKGKLRTVKTPGGHHRIAQAELDRYLHRGGKKPGPGVRAGYRRISGRNQLVGRIVEVKSSGLVAQVVISIGGQHITSLITADAAREMGLKIGETAAALIKATEVMIIRV
jgi:molybdopterin-binding protein